VSFSAVYIRDRDQPGKTLSNAPTYWYSYTVFVKTADLVSNTSKTNRGYM